MAKKSQDIEVVVRQRLLNLRKERGFTQQALSEVAGVSSDAAARIESGARIPSLPTLARLATALGVHVSDLVETGDNVPEPRLSGPIQRVVRLLEQETEATQQLVATVAATLIRELRSRK